VGHTGPGPHRGHTISTLWSIGSMLLFLTSDIVEFLNLYKRGKKKMFCVKAAYSPLKFKRNKHLIDLKACLSSEVMATA
jgi:hypothetical protein